jgi:hypothetical protein
MSYIAYINGHLLELTTSSPIAYNKQVNDLARLDNRQSNFTHKFTVPHTAGNARAMESVYFVGNQSNLPYQKNTFDLIDADSGKHLVYKGWAVLSQTTKKGFEISVYDGIIDFYRKIENKTITDIGISGLNHSKSVANIIDSWNNTKPYMYAIADYNGKNTFVNTAGNTIGINTDYQIPSARVSYIWNQIHAFAGFTYSGSYFNTEKFKNWFMSFPNPVPTLVPITENISTQQCSFNLLSGIQLYQINLLPIPIQNSIYINASGVIQIAGVYQISGVSTLIVNGSPYGNICQGGLLGIPTGPTANLLNNETLLLTFNVGDILSIGSPNLFNSYPSDGNIITTFSYVTGYDANFSQAFLDFKATDFINEVVQQAGLTAYKSKYENHIEYFTMSEILQSNNVLDWSRKFQYKDTEKYRIGNYAKKNIFKYRYNTENQNHNDGYILINDTNLPDENNILVSKTYSPESNNSFISGKSVPVFKIWDKELQDDSSIKYKDLTGRFYFIRFEKIPYQTKIGTESLITESDVTSIAFAKYTDLNFQSVIQNNYATIISILDKAKAIDGYFWLKPNDIEKFDFKSLIYVEQLGSYYLVNKIVNFIKGKVTKCELIEVDYLKTIEVPNPTIYTIQITNWSVSNCILTFDVNTNLPNGTNVFVVENLFSVIGNNAVQENGVLNNNQVVVPMVNFLILPTGFYIAAIDPNLQNIQSNIVQIPIDGSCTMLYINVSDKETLANGDLQVVFTTNLLFPFNLILQSASGSTQQVTAFNGIVVFPSNEISSLMFPYKLVAPQTSTESNEF